MTDLVQASPRKDAAGGSLAFIVITYALTWAIFFAVAAAPKAVFAGAPEGVRQALILPAVFMPALTALGLSAWRGGWTGVKTLLAPLLRWRVGWRWFVYAAGFMVAIKLIVALAYAALYGEWPRFGATPLPMLAISILVSTPFQAGEEIGWRGYLLPRLAARVGFGPAAVLVGLVWAAWHLPLFFMPGSDVYGQSFLVYALAVTGLSVAITWLYVNTRGSLLLTMIMHAAANNTAGVVASDLPHGTLTWTAQSSPVGWLTAAVLWAVAGCLLVWMAVRRKRTPASLDTAPDGGALTT